jgi:two-component system, NtrC family, nitrogen regulation response regulator NtrX
MDTILVVDDEQPIRDLLITFLGNAGYRAVGAEDGATAISEARKLKPRVILLDIAMPGMNGIETLKKLREREPNSTVIMMSGHADHQTALKALDLGAFDFIEKPFDFQYLQKVLIMKLPLSG